MAPPSASRPANPRARVHRGPTRTGRVRLLHRLASVAILAWLLSSKRMLQRYEAFSRSLIAPELKQARSILWVTAHRQSGTPNSRPALASSLSPEVRHSPPLNFSPGRPQPTTSHSSSLPR